MAEEILIADARIGLEKYGVDLSLMTKQADKASEQVTKALEEINKSVKDLPENFDKFNKELKATEKAANEAGRGVSAFERATGGLKGALAGLGLTLTIGSFAALGKSVLTAGSELQSLERQLTRTEGSLGSARQAIDFVRETSLRLGLDVGQSSEEFVRLANAADGTIIAGEGVKAIFQGVSTAGAAMGRTSAETSGAMRQLSQMIATQQVQWEDISIVMDNGIPIMDALSKATGIAKENMRDAFSKDQIKIEDIVLAAQQLTEDFQGLADAAENEVANSFSRMWESLKIGFQEASAGILESSELKKLLGGAGLSEVNWFGTREENTQMADDLIASALGVIAIINNVAEKVRDAIASLFDKIAEKVNAVKNLVPEGGLVGAGGRLLKSWFGSAEDADKAAQKTQEAIKQTDKVAEEAGKGEKSLLDKLMFGGFSLKDFRQQVEQIKKQLGVIAPPAEVKEQGKKDGTEYAKGISEGYLQELKASKEKRLKAISAEDAAKAAKKAAEEELKFLEEVAKEHDKAAKRRLEIFEEIEKAKEAADKRELERQKELADAIQERIKERRKAEEEAAERQEEINKVMRESIQEGMSDILASGLDDFENFGDAVIDIFKRVGAELATAMVFQPMMDKAMQSVTDFLNGTGGLGEVEPGTGNVSGSRGFLARIGLEGQGQQVMQSVGGMAAGAGVGAGVNNMLGGGITGGVVGGAVGGAIAGSMILPGIGTAVGAVVGALAGLTAALLTAEEKIRLAPLTSGAPPGGNVQNGVVRRGPFGFISLVDQSSNTSPGATNTAATIIAEADAAIARLMTQRQRDIVSQALQSQHYALDAREMDDAIAQALQTRLFIAIRQLAGEGAALNIVGDPYTGTSENIQALQQRAAEALGLLKKVEEFKLLPLGSLAQEIHRIREEFSDMIMRAQSLGLDTTAVDLMHEQHRQIQEMVGDFNMGIRSQILGIINPAQQAAEELQKQQDEVWKNAVAAHREGAVDLEEVQRLFRLQWEEHAKRFEESGGVVNDGLDALNKAIEQFARGTMSSAGQQIAALRDRFNELLTEAHRLGAATNVLIQSYHEQHNAIVVAAQRNVQAAILGIANPFGAALLQIQIQAEEFQKLANDGIINQSTVNQYRNMATEQAMFGEANRIAGGGASSAAEQLYDTVWAFASASVPISDLGAELNSLNETAYNLMRGLSLIGDRQGIAMVAESLRQQSQEIIRQAHESVASIINSFGTPFTQAMIQAENQIAELRKLVVDGLVSQTYVQIAEQLVRGQALAEEALRRIEGAPVNAIEQVAEAFDAFIGGASPLTEAGQELHNLTENFINLVDAASLLGYSTADLESAYIQQSRTIRERAIADIDRQLQAQINAIDTISDYLDSIRVAPEQALNIRLDEAQKQFKASLAGSDTQDMVEAARTLRDIARLQFGSTSGFFAVENQIEAALGSVRDREQAAVDAERQRMREQLDREIRQLEIGQSSLDQLHRVAHHGQQTANGVDMLVQLAREAQARDERLISLIERSVARSRA